MPGRPHSRRSPALRRLLMFLILVAGLVLLGSLAVRAQATTPFAAPGPASPSPASPCTGEACLTPPTPSPSPCPDEACLAPSPSPCPDDACIVPSLATASLATASIAAPSPSPSPASPCTGEACLAPESPDAAEDAAASPATPSAGSGTLFLALQDGGYTHLYAYHPQRLPLTRLTAGAWDDTSPAASPDGSRLAFASDREGPWDLYLLDLSTGETTRLTDTPEYDAAPSWSPDGRWLAYESYSGDETTGNLDIFILEIPDGSLPGLAPVRLTDDPGPDYAPAWSPAGRQIAFVSYRTGEAEIWLADLDQVDSRFQNLSSAPGALDEYPAWSPDGSLLAWTSRAGGFQNLLLWNPIPGENGSPARLVGSGGRSAWSPDGGALAAALDYPHASYLTGYTLPEAALALPPVALPGPLSGLAWSKASLSPPLPGPLAQAAALTPTPVWSPALNPSGDVPADRRQLAPLTGVETNFAFLQDLVDESFQAFRLQLYAQLGWDFLTTLENAYVPLTTPLFPGMSEDWLYTGRAIAVSPAPLYAGWMVVQREDFAAETYWRIFLRARFQDGSQGRPLYHLPWEFRARSSGDLSAYEAGGALVDIFPAGYWVDFTRLAASYGWRRLPALSTWRHAYPAARFNQYVLDEGLTWHTAMQELYPAEALETPPILAPPPSLTPPTPEPALPDLP